MHKYHKVWRFGLLAIYLRFGEQRIKLGAPLFYTFDCLSPMYFLYLFFCCMISAQRLENDKIDEWGYTRTKGCGLCMVLFTFNYPYKCLFLAWYPLGFLSFKFHTEHFGCHFSSSCPHHHSSQPIYLV